MKHGHGARRRGSGDCQGHSTGQVLVSWVLPAVSLPHRGINCSSSPSAWHRTSRQRPGALLGTADGGPCGFCSRPLEARTPGSLPHLVPLAKRPGVGRENGAGSQHFSTPSPGGLAAGSRDSRVLAPPPPACKAAGGAEREAGWEPAPRGLPQPIPRGCSRAPAQPRGRSSLAAPHTPPGSPGDSRGNVLSPPTPSRAAPIGCFVDGRAPPLADAVGPAPPEPRRRPEFEPGPGWGAGRGGACCGPAGKRDAIPVPPPTPHRTQWGDATGLDAGCRLPLQRGWVCGHV